LVKLREVTGRRVKAEEFKTVRTVGDLLDSLENLRVRPETIHWNCLIFSAST
jgi:hypothetical protein